MVVTVIQRGLDVPGPAAASNDIRSGFDHWPWRDQIILFEPETLGCIDRTESVPEHMMTITGMISGLAGSNARSEAPVSGSLWSTFWNDRPPSVDRNTSRSSFGPYGCPRTATNRRLASRGSKQTENRIVD